MFQKVLGVVGIVIAGFALTTCGLLTTGTEGTVVLTFAPQGMLVARTIEPPLGMEPASYDVFGTGPAGRTFEQIGVPPGGVVQASLIPGEWTIVVHAYNDDNPRTKIGEGRATVTVVAGAVVTVKVQVYPLEGPGQLLLTVTWPQNVLLGPEVTGTLTPLGGSADAIVFSNAPDDLSADFASPGIAERDALQNGYYTLSLSLTTENPDGSGPVHAWGIVEAVRIVAGQISSKLYELVEDVNHGGLIVDPNMDNPLEITISGVVDPLIAGGDMTVTASPSGQDSYLWYLNGAPLLDGGGVQMTGETITFGSDVGLGYHWLSVVVTSGSVLSSDAERFEVVSGTPPQIEVDRFSGARASVELIAPDGTVRMLELEGALTIEVGIGPGGEDPSPDTGGDQVETEIVSMSLSGETPIGPVVLTVNPNIGSAGAIRERENYNPGILDLLPFVTTPDGLVADSFFDVFLDLELTGIRLVNTVPARLTSAITYKPAAPYEAYSSADRTPLFDENGNPSGFALGAIRLIPDVAPRLYSFPNVIGTTELVYPDGSQELIDLAGSISVAVGVGPRGEDASPDLPFDTVKTEMVSMSLSGDSSLGPVSVSLHPDIASTGAVTENDNLNLGFLDIPPFVTTPPGLTANSFFDVFFEIDVGGLVLYNHRTQSTVFATISSMPPAPGERYASIGTVGLYDGAGNPTGFALGASTIVLGDVAP